MPTLRPLLASAPEPTLPFHARLLAYPILLALLGILIAAIAITTGQDYRREHALLQLDNNRAHLANALAEAQRENADSQNATTHTDLAPYLTFLLQKAYASDIPSYAKYGRQFTSWDGYRYEEIVEQGYVYHLPSDPPDIQNSYGILRPGWPEMRTKNVVWYPLYPALGWLVSHTFHISANHALTSVSWTCCLLAAIVTFLFARRHFFNHLPAAQPALAPAPPAKLAPHDLAALWALALLLFGPCSLFLYANFTESLFVLLLASFLYCLQSRWWWRAALVAAAASACRSQGVLFGPILALTYLLRAPENLPLNKLTTAFLLGLLSALGLACYMLFLQVQFGDPLAFMHAQKFWNVGIGPTQLLYALNPLHALAHIKSYIVTPGPIDWPRLWEALCLLWPPILLLAFSRRILTFELQLFGWILWGLPYVSKALAGDPPRLPVDEHGPLRRRHAPRPPHPRRPNPTPPLAGHPLLRLLDLHLRPLRHQIRHRRLDPG